MRLRRRRGAPDAHWQMFLELLLVPGTIAGTSDSEEQNRIMSFYASLGVESSRENRYHSKSHINDNYRLRECYGGEIWDVTEVP
jgi:hypothetical protein